MPLGDGVWLLLLEEADDLLGSLVILLLSASGVLDDELDEVDDGESLPDAPIDWVPELLWADALDLLWSADILALSELDEEDGVEGELLAAEGEVLLLVLVCDFLLVEVPEAPMDLVLELSWADWVSLLFSAAFLSESSLAASILSLAFSAVCLVLSPIFLKVSLIRSVMELPDVWLSVADGVAPGLSCCARAPVPARASVQARAMKVRFMGISLECAMPDQTVRRLAEFVGPRRHHASECQVRCPGQARPFCAMVRPEATPASP